MVNRYQFAVFINVRVIQVFEQIMQGIVFEKSIQDLLVRYGQIRITKNFKMPSQIKGDPIDQICRKSPHHSDLMDFVQCLAVQFQRHIQM